MGIGDWGLGIGDWGDWGLGPIPNPQSPIPNPQSPIKFKYLMVLLYNNIFLLFNKNINKYQLNTFIYYFKILKFSYLNTV